MVSMQKTGVIKHVDLKSVTVSLLEGDIIKLKIKEKCIVDVDDVKEVQAVKRSLIGDKKHTVLFVTPNFGSMTREARDYSASPEVNRNAVAKAIVLNGLAMRIITNFFINFNKPPVEHRAFENEKDALKWLRSLTKF